MVTVLFADVVGFTTLAERQDPERVKRLVDQLFERLGADIEAFGGRVDKVVGDAIVALFGAPVAHEDDAERAVRSALAMQDTLCDLAPALLTDLDTDGSVRLRIGVNTGEVVVGSVARSDYTAMGDVVNTASRLQALAPPGGVLVGDATRVLCSDAIGFEPLEPTRLRGREQVEQIWQVVSATPVAGRSRPRTPTVFVGRAAERSVLTSVAALAATGQSAVVTLTGEPGIGKSRLVDDVLETLRVRRPDLQVFDGACAPYGETNVWSPLATGLLGHLGVSRDASPDEAAAAIRAGTAAWFDAAAGPVRHGVEALIHLAGLPSELDAVDPSAARTAVFAAVVAGIRACAQQGPVVVRIDDLQWSHAALRDLLTVLARSLVGCPFLLVTTARPDEAVEWPPEVDRAVVVTMPIGPLGRRESALLVDALAARSLDPDLVERLHDRSGGNPLFLVELASLAIDGVEPGADVELPGTLRALIAARLDQLPPERRAIVDNAAIIGSGGAIASLREFATALGQPFEVAWLEELEAVGMLEVEGGWWRFRSDVVREVAYQTLTKQARALRHAGVASVLAGYDRPPIERMAHHAASAAELLDDLGTVPGVHPSIRLQAVELLQQAAARSFDVGGFRRGTDLVERALALVDPTDAGARLPLLLLRATGLVELRSPAPARLVLDELLALAVAAGDRAVEGQAHRLLGSVEQLDGNLVAARAELGAAVAIFRELDDPAQLALALRVRGFAEVFGGSLQDAEWYLGEADDVYATLGDVRGRAWIEHSRGWVRFLSGDNVRAERHLRDAIAAFDAIGDHAGSTWSNGILAFLAFYEGRFEDAEALAGEVSREARQWGDEWGASMMLTLLSAIRLWSGRFAEAIELGERALVGFRRIGDSFGAVQALAPVSRARAALGKTADADRGMEELLSVADSFGEMSFPTMAAAGVAMHLGRGARAVELSLEAVERMASGGGGVPEAKVQLAASLVLAERPEDALVVLDELDVPASSFALAVRGLARAATGDDAGAAADADAVMTGDARSYFDRSLASIVAAAVAARRGGPGAAEAISRALIVTRAGADVHLMAVAAEIARHHGVATGPGEARPTEGWATVAAALTRPVLGGVA